jgi:hypothetical protein
MSTLERYEEAVHCLSQYSYEVIADGQGYIVRHTTDVNDVSRVRHLADLIDLAELIEWRYRRQIST